MEGVIILHGTEAGLVNIPRNQERAEIFKTIIVLMIRKRSSGWL